MVNFEFGGPQKREFTVSLRGGDALRYLPLNLVNPHCQQVTTGNNDSLVFPRTSEGLHLHTLDLYMYCMWCSVWERCCNSFPSRS